MPVRANNVSSALRRCGFNPIGSGSNRAGLKAKQSIMGRVRVVADLDTDADARRLAAAAQEALSEAGWQTTGLAPDEFAFYVTGRS